MPGDTIRVGGQAYDLTDRAQALAFARTLRLPPAQTQAVADAIHGANEDTTDKLAQLARVWAQAERGESMPSRFVLSGHSVGDGEWWGDDNGILLRKAVGDLADAMPRAARQVEDLHLAGCYAGGRRDVDQWRAIFPNVKTVWAYSESAPGSHSGAQTHLARWARATRGPAKNLDRSVARGTRKGDNVAVWSIDGGYDDGNPPVPIAALRAMVARGEPTFQSYFDGSIMVSSTQHGALRDYYHVQALVQRPDLNPGQERKRMESRRDQTIRLIYYSKTVAKNFADHHASRIEAGFRAMGMPVPDFAQLSRADALRAIERFEQAVADASAAPEAARELLPLLTNGLRDLDKTVIPHNWI